MNYKDLRLWQKSMDLAEDVYKLVKKLPKEETYVLSDQLRRAVISIPSNIAEGYGKGSTKEYIKFLTISRGSCNEVETQLLLGIRLGFFTKEDTQALFETLDAIERMFNVLINKLSDKVEG